MKRQSYAEYEREVSERFGNHLLKNYFQLGNYWGKKLPPDSEERNTPTHDTTHEITTEQAYVNYKKLDDKK